MRCNLALFAVMLLLATALSQQAMGVVLRNPGFDEGTQGYSGHWWSPWDWYTFTVCPPYSADPMPPAEYVWRDCWTGPAGLPSAGEINCFPAWGNVGFAFDPTVGLTPDQLDHRTCAWCDTSDGYDHPRKAGEQYMKQWQNRRAFAGFGQYVGRLEVGKTYEVSAYGFNSAEVNPPDMRILIDPNGGNDARAASISSPSVPNHPRGRFWIWSSEGNNRIGDFNDLSAPDVTGCYCIYDKVSVQFTATSPNATIFLLVDGTNWNDYAENDFAVAWDQVSIREVHPPVSSIPAAKDAPDGTPVTLSGVVVSGVYPNGLLDDGGEPCFFVQDAGRASGILVLSGRTVEPGDVVTLTGATKTYMGSVAVKADGMPSRVAGTVPKPVGVTNVASGGARVAGGEGVDTLGLLTQIWGRVIESGQWTDPLTGDLTYAYVLLDDGSAAESAPAQPVLNATFEGFNTDTWGNPSAWGSKKSMSATSYMRVWWYGLWDCLVAPTSGRTYVGRVNGKGQAWFWQQIFSLSAGESATLKAYAFAGGNANAKVRIGVDPNGGTSQTATSIIWSPYVNTNGAWQELSVNFNTRSAPNASTFTVWLESNHPTTDPEGWFTGFDDVRVYANSVSRKGVKVLLPMGSFPPVPGEYWSVVGNLWTELQPGETAPTRFLIPRSPQDIVAISQ